MDLSKLKPSDWMVGGGAVAFLIAMFLPWYGVSEGGFSTNDSGFSYFLTGIIPFLLILAAVVAIVLPKLADGVSIPDPIGPLPKAQAALIAAGVAAILVILRLVIKSDNINGFDLSAVGAGDEVQRKFGLVLAVLAAIAVAVGSFLNFQEGDAAGPSSTAPPTPF